MTYNGSVTVLQFCIAAGWSLKAPIQELLNGGSSSIVYNVTIKGDSAGRGLRSYAIGLRVRSLNAKSNNGVVTWQVNVSDEDAAEDQMLRLILENRNFKRKKLRA